MKSKMAPAQYNPVQRMVAELWAYLCPGVVEITEKNQMWKNEKNKAFWILLKKATCFTD